MRWWKDRSKRLWWKELRESYPVVSMGWLVILAMSYRIPRSVSSRYVWGMDFNVTATAILVFVALVLGVTAYAVEDEYETLEPLSAKPILPGDILATKLGVRLGLLFLSSIFIGILELVTGAWPIEYGIPSPIVFERWAGSLMIMISGLGLGFYFGKVLGKQITGLLSAALLFAAGWILLELSPLAFLFEGDSGGKIYWIKIILIPAAGGTIAIIASIRARAGAGGPLSRPAVAVLALAGYAAISWTLTIVPPGRAWVSGDQYKSYWTIRFGSPEAGLDILYNQLADRDASYMEDDPDSLAVIMILGTNIWRPTERKDNALLIQSTFLGMPGTERQYRPDTYGRVNALTSHERVAAENRNAEWIIQCLEAVRQSRFTDYHRMIALHLAGVSKHPELVDPIASYLDDPSPNVRLMAAYMLVAWDDARGKEALADLLGVIKRKSLLQDIAIMIQTWDIEPGPEFEDLMREWIAADNYRGDRINRRVAQRWFLKNGTIEDIEIVRRSLWLDYRDSFREYSSPADMPIWDHLEAWGYPDLIDEMYRQARKIIQGLDEKRASYLALRDKKRTTWTREDRMTISTYSQQVNFFIDIMVKLGEHGDPGVIELWRNSRHLIEISIFRYRNRREIPIIAHLPGLGTPGFDVLKELAGNPGEKPAARLQASMILAYNGYREFDETALWLYELYRHNDGEINLWDRRGILREAFLVMISNENLRYAGPIIEDAWNVFKNRGSSRYYYGSFYRYMRVGTSFWNNVTVQILEESTDQKYGWDLKAWKRWWDREGRVLASAGN